MEMETYLKWQRMNPKLSVPKVCYIVFWKSLFKGSHPCLWDVELGNREGERCLLAEIMYENNFHECGRRIKFSFPAERNRISLRKLLKSFFVSEIYKIPSVQTAFFTILTTRYLILPQASYPSGGENSQDNLLRERKQGMHLSSLTHRFYLLIFRKTFLLYFNGSHSIVIPTLYMRWTETQKDKVTYSGEKQKRID